MALPHRAALVPSSPSCLGLVCDKPGAQHIRGLRPSPPPFFPGFLTQSLRRQPGPQPPCSLWPRPLGSSFAALGFCFLICKEDLGPSGPPPGLWHAGGPCCCWGHSNPTCCALCSGEGGQAVLPGSGPLEQDLRQGVACDAAGGHGGTRRPPPGDRGDGCAEPCTTNTGCPVWEARGQPRVWVAGQRLTGCLWGSWLNEVWSLLTSVTTHAHTGEVAGPAGPARPAWGGTLTKPVAGRTFPPRPGQRRPLTAVRSVRVRGLLAAPGQVAGG